MCRGWWWLVLGEYAKERFGNVDRKGQDNFALGALDFDSLAVDEQVLVGACAIFVRVDNREEWA